MRPGGILSSVKYTRVFALQECEESKRDVVNTIVDEFSECRQRKQYTWWVIVALSLGGLIAGGAAFLSLKSAPDSSCRNPVVRREWRSLSRDEKEEYIGATQCLQQNPSRLGLDHSLYHDFPYIHIHVGNHCEYSSLHSNTKGNKKGKYRERKNNEATQLMTL